MLGTVFMFLYNAISAILRGMGDSKRPLYFVAIAAAVNVVGDIVLVGPLKMGAAGAAIATISSQGISVILVFVFDADGARQFSAECGCCVCLSGNRR